jgi:hypothetical protein
MSKTYEVGTRVWTGRSGILDCPMGLVMRDLGDKVQIFSYGITNRQLEIPKEYITDESELTLEEYLKLKLTGRTIQDIKLDKNAEGAIIELSRDEWLHVSIVNKPGSFDKKFDICFTEVKRSG